MLLLPTLLLGSCMAPAQARVADGPSPDEARDALYLSLDKTQDLIGGSWDNRDDPTARGCTLPAGEEGLSFAALRVGPAQSVSVIAGVWEGWGYTVERTVVGPVVQLVATGEDGELMILRASDRATTLQGESECRPE